MKLKTPSKVIKCKNCGKRVGTVRLKRIFHIEVFAITFLIALITQFIAELLVNWILFEGAGRGI